MADKKLRPKYVVFRVVDEKIASGGTPLVQDIIKGTPMLSTDPDDVDSPFVLMPRKDPAAYYALLNYAQACEADLAYEIREWAEKIVKAPPVCGTQGMRNRVEMKLKQMRLFT